MTDGIATADVELLNVEEPAFSPPGLPPGEWVRKNLFNSVLNSIVTIVVAIAGLAFAWFAVGWVVDQDFQIVRSNLRLFAIGQFPNDELWRPWLSAYVLVVALGLGSGARSHLAYEQALETGLPAHRTTWLELLKRFWAVVAVLVFFVSFARTALPYVGLAGIFAAGVVTREIGWRLPAAIRQRVTYVCAILLVISMLVLAGTSRLGGVVLGLIVFVWVSSEMGRRDLAPTAAGRLLRWGIPLVAAIVVYAIETLISFDGFGWEDWGGLHISLFTAVVGITLGMPFGILLALGRKSDLPVIKTASVIFIEFVRGVPLISLLLFSNLMLPFFLPIDFERPADLTLAIIVITGFSAAYIAEIVRGGLQAVPKGQTEAAQAMGLSAGAVQRLIILPQALRAVIPAMVGQFIALFKDTSLLSIIGILEFLRVSDVANSQPDFVGKGLAPVTYLFVAVGYWAFAYTMSKESRRLETRLSTSR